MPNTWITDLRHYLDETVNFPPDLPPEAFNLASHLGKIVEAITARKQIGIAIATGISCRRRPEHKKCSGKIAGLLDQKDGNRIKWSCPACGENGVISGWQETMWDKAHNPAFL